MRLIAALAITGAAILAGVGPLPTGLDAFFVDLHRRNLADGAVVVPDATGVVFAKGFGPANAARDAAFTPDTPAANSPLKNVSIGIDTPMAYRHPRQWVARLHVYPVSHSRGLGHCSGVGGY